MAKKNILKKQEEFDNFDFSEILDSSYDDDVMAGMLSALLEASNNQMMLAIELTKLALGKNSSNDMKEGEVFSIFKKASGVIAENFPLKSLLENLPTNH